MNLNLKKLLAVFCVMAIVLGGSTVVLATNHDFQFQFTNLSNQYTSEWPKSDGETNWYLTTSGVNISASNVFGCKMHRDTEFSNYPDNVDVYRTYTSYVTKRVIAYQNKDTIAMGDWMYMGGKKDSSSTTSSELDVVGVFAP